MELIASRGQLLRAGAFRFRPELKCFAIKQIFRDKTDIPTAEARAVALQQFFSECALPEREEKVESRSRLLRAEAHRSRTEFRCSEIEQIF